MATKPLTDLIPILYKALDTVSREVVGFIPSVAVNAAPTTAAKGETIRIPVANASKAEDIQPGVPTSKGDPDFDNIDMVIEKSRMVPVKWDGESQLGVGNNGNYEKMAQDQFAQAFRTLSNEVEADLASLYKYASRAYGTPGKTPFKDGIGDSAQIRKVLMDNGCPTSDLQLVVDTTAGANLRSNAQLTKVSEAGTEATLRHGELLNLNSFSIKESSQIRTHSPGTTTGSAAVNNTDGYGVGSSLIAIDGVSSIALKAGDMLSFGTGEKMYLVPENCTATPIKIAAPGLMDNVADDASVKLVGAYTPCLAFDRNALQLIARTPAMPKGGDEADDVTIVSDPVSGLSFQVAVYRGYRLVRYEVGLAWGVKLIKPEHCALLIG